MGIQRPRDANQVLGDRLLFLFALKESEQYGSIRLIKMQKMFFYSEYLMNKRKERGFNLLFRRHKFGPYSDDLEKDMKDLASVQFIKIDDKSIELDEFGERILFEAEELLLSNKWLSETISQSAKKIVPMVNDSVLNFIYKLPVESKFGKTVEDIPDGGTIIRPLDDKISEKKFVLDEDWIETLDVLFDVKTTKNLLRILEHHQPEHPSIFPFVVD
jgi:uncharacterized protein YwgA